MTIDVFTLRRSNPITADIGKIFLYRYAYSEWSGNDYGDSAKTQYMIERQCALFEGVTDCLVAQDPEKYKDDPLVVYRQPVAVGSWRASEAISGELVGVVRNGVFTSLSHERETLVREFSSLFRGCRSFSGSLLSKVKSVVEVLNLKSKNRIRWSDDDKRLGELVSLYYQLHGADSR